MNVSELLSAGQLLHGHKCPAMPIGLRAGLAALKKLNTERATNKELHCFLENGPAHATMCFGDGVQVATGCTFGKGNVEKLNQGKNAITLVDKKHNKAVRVSVKPEFLKAGLNSHFVQLRKKGIEPVDIDPTIVGPMIENIMTLPDEDMFRISDVFDYNFKGQKGTFEWHECSSCGEIVFASGARLKEGKVVCIPCSQ